MTRGSAHDSLPAVKLKLDGQFKQGARERRRATAKPAVAKPHKKIRPKHKRAPCEGTIFSRLDRTKMFHVKLFCTIDPQDV